MTESGGKEQGSGRRAFFRNALQKAAGPVVDAVEHVLPLPSTRAATPLLRPPGALPEADFLQMCYRSGNCMDACPAAAIQPLKDEDPNLSGTPTIVPSTRACVVCESLACMSACPSGALTSLLRHQIRIGLAAVDYGLCLRKDGGGRLRGASRLRGVGRPVAPEAQRRVPGGADTGTRMPGRAAIGGRLRGASRLRAAQRRVPGGADTGTRMSGRATTTLTRTVCCASSVAPSGGRRSGCWRTAASA